VEFTGPFSFVDCGALLLLDAGFGALAISQASSCDQALVLA